jgi:hypothetical protein
MGYRVFVDENFHYMDHNHRYALGDYATYAEAFAACKELVDRFLRHEYVPGMPASALYFRYMMFGRDPFLVNGTDGTEAQPGFSAWDYAKARCAELCSDSSDVASRVAEPASRTECTSIHVDVVMQSA